MFRDIIKKYLSLNTRTLNTRTNLEISLNTYLVWQDAHILRGIWKLRQMQVHSGANLLVLCFHFARSLQLDLLKLIHMCSELLPMAVQATHPKDTWSSGLVGTKCSLPQLAGHGSDHTRWYMGWPRSFLGHHFTA